MNDHPIRRAVPERHAGDGALTARIAAEVAVPRILARLRAAYPGFTFSRETVSPWRGPRWVADRKDHTAPGTRCVITGDLMELHRELQPYKASGA